MKKRVIAIHLPQFYPFPENDEWWGKGFTEWRNVTMAKPRFYGHYQPHIPSDLGFYDLRMHEARKAQQDLARQYEIDGFCYYHYWFNGHLIMEKPIEAMLNDKSEDFPFMLCWANENWHRNWAGKSNVVLIEQHYCKEDDIAHFKYLLPYFKDKRYIRINGKPVFAIYRPHLIPNAEELIKTFQSEANKEGFQLYICKFETKGCSGKEYMKPGIDAAIDFQPLNDFNYMSLYKLWIRLINKIMPYKIGMKFSYEKYTRYQCKLIHNTDYKVYPCVFPCWDNSSRRAKQVFAVYNNSTPYLFEKYFRTIYQSFEPYSDDENLVFINAWNEWAEGCHLEPDMKHGRGYLEAVKNVIESK